MLLVQPPQGTNFGLTRILTGEPLGLECVGGAVRSHGYDAELVDLRLDSWDALDRSLQDAPDLIGLSCAFTTDVYPSLEAVGFIKERRPEVPVVVGGHHASLIPEDFLYPNSGVDAVVVGEGETTATELMDAVQRRTPIGAVPGVMTPENRPNGFTRRGFSRAMDTLTGPDRSLTARYRGRYHHGPNPRAASVETSRGCPFDCNFCSVWRFYERRTGQRSPASIVTELEGLEEKTVFFTDDIAFLNHDAYRELGERIRASGVRKKYSCESRADLVLKHRDIFALWKEVGLDTVFLGIEKIDDEGLAALRKRTKGGANANVQAIRMLRETGITPMTIFITDPQWGEDDFDRLEEFIDHMNLPSSAFTILTPLPGTELYETRKDELLERDYGYYDLAHAVLPTRLPLERFYERFSRLFARTVDTSRPSWAMLRRAMKLTLQGDAWCMRRVYGAMRQLRNPASYLAKPERVRAPRRLQRLAPPRLGLPGEESATEI